MISHLKTGLFCLFREYNGYYSVVCRLSQELAENSYGILTTGCVNAPLNIAGRFHNKKHSLVSDINIKMSLTVHYNIQE